MEIRERLLMDTWEETYQVKYLLYITNNLIKSEDYMIIPILTIVLNNNPNLSMLLNRFQDTDNSFSVDKVIYLFC